MKQTIDKITDQLTETTTGTSMAAVVFKDDDDEDDGRVGSDVIASFTEESETVADFLLTAREAAVGFAQGVDDETSEHLKKEDGLKRRCFGS